MGRRAERHGPSPSTSSATGATRSAARSASPAATTSCSSSTRHEYRPARRPAATTDELPHADRARAHAATSRRPSTTTARSTTSSTTRRPACPRAQLLGDRQTACFQDGGVLGRIPVSRLYGPGMALLNQYPLPNNDAGRRPQLQLHDHAAGAEPADATRRRSGWTTRRRRTAADRQVQRHGQRVVIGSRSTAIGSAAGLHRHVQKFPLSFNTSGTVNYTINTDDVPRGHVRHEPEPAGHAADLPVSNRDNIVCPADLAAQVAELHARRACRSCSRTPASSIPATTSTGRSQEIGTPFFRETAAILLPPQLQLGRHAHRRSRRRASTTPGFMNINRTQQSSSA